MATLIDESSEEMKVKAENLALDWVKQIITLASGVVALSVTFIENLVKNVNCLLILLVLSWALLILSIIYGLSTISNFIAYNLGSLSDWSSGVCKKNASACKWFFISGIGVFALFGTLMIITQ
jgi:hypothetical protein